MAKVMKTVTGNVQVKRFCDQSIFVKAAVSGVVREGCRRVPDGDHAAAVLGSWRSTLIVAISIPLSVVTSLPLLRALGETINLMRLSGLALAVVGFWWVTRR